MHVPESELFDVALGLRSLLKPHGRLLLSIPVARTDVGLNGRDEHGRLFQSYVPEELQLLLERLGFQPIGRWDNDDALQRAGTEWVTMLLELHIGGQPRAVDQIEAILNRDRKVATYKFALFRALAEMATQEPRCARWLPSARVAVPLNRIAWRWLLYYWPIFANERFVPQSQAEGAGNLHQPLAFRAPLTALIREFAGQGAAGGLTAWHLARTAGRVASQTLSLEHAALSSIANAIRSGPVTHAGGALESGRVFAYDPKGKAVVMPPELWRELCLLGHWIIDAVVLRWAALTERFAHRQGLRSGDVLPLLLTRPEPERATAQARSVFQSAGLTHCVWSARPLIAGRFAVDHIIPFALWGNNDLWNLVPTHPAVNGEKSDKLPSTPLLLERQDAIVESWAPLRDAMPDAFNRQAQSLLGLTLSSGDGWQQTLFTRVRQAIEETALQRGVERWRPPNGAGKRRLNGPTRSRRRLAMQRDRLTTAPRRYAQHAVMNSSRA